VINSKARMSDTALLYISENQYRQYLDQYPHSWGKLDIPKESNYLSCFDPLIL
jgi:hypothetical protein